MTKKWFKISDEDIGKQFKVIKPFSISREKPTGPYSWTMENKQLKENDIITYLGMKQGWGSDNIPQHNFEFEGFRGEVDSPAAPFKGWGSIAIGYIERI